MNHGWSLSPREWLSTMVLLLDDEFTITARLLHMEDESWIVFINFNNYFINFQTMSCLCKREDCLTREMIVDCFNTSWEDYLTWRTCCRQMKSPLNTVDRVHHLQINVQHNDLDFVVLTPSRCCWLELFGIWNEDVNVYVDFTNNRVVEDVAMNMGKNHGIGGRSVWSNSLSLSNVAAQRGLRVFSPMRDANENLLHTMTRWLSVLRTRDDKSLWDCLVVFWLSLVPTVTLQ